ncbi:hypothetical protein AGOR_G00067580 [Albula goreensis]|uniref:Uncharacterized protein n=1 Tax=Albula goreensis TaxID=1534307 RepID=A0A8T3DX54_9TELE|nr:hypothetical protein AGOR_G00067580 [Albula goreensis]
MVRLELEDPLALLVLLGREESKDSPDPPASRVCPDPQAPLVREVNPVTRVFLVRLEQLVLLDPEASVVSLAREEELGPRACRDPAAFPELQELTDPRELSAQAAVLELRVLPVFRACLVREELPEFPDPRVTEVTMERKDQRVLLAKMEPEV